MGAMSMFLRTVLRKTQVGDPFETIADASRVWVAISMCTSYLKTRSWEWCPRIGEYHVYHRRGSNSEPRAPEWRRVFT